MAGPLVIKRLNADFPILKLHFQVLGALLKKSFSENFKKHVRNFSPAPNLSLKKYMYFECLWIERDVVSLSLYPMIVVAIVLLYGLREFEYEFGRPGLQRGD